ncbi:MAG: YwbE family protein [Bacteroidota bacterium]
MDGRKRSNIQPGMEVGVVLKKDQRTENITYGVVEKLLTKSNYHPHGIKVMLENGQVGRVKEIID